MRRKAKLYWIPKNEGGRGSTPDMSPYRSPVRFLNTSTPPDGVTWDLKVEKISNCASPNEYEVYVSFSNPEGPHQILVAGVEFELYEGHKTVARGRILA